MKNVLKIKGQLQFRRKRVNENFPLNLTCGLVVLELEPWAEFDSRPGMLSIYQAVS